MSLPTPEQIDAMTPEQLRAFALGVLAGSRRRRVREPEAKQALTINEAARILGVSRRRTLMPAIEAGTIATVDWASGKRHEKRIPRGEVERILREGWPKETVTPPKRGRVRRASRRPPLEDQLDDLKTFRP